MHLLPYYAVLLHHFFVHAYKYIQDVDRYDIPRHDRQNLIRRRFQSLLLRIHCVRSLHREYPHLAFQIKQM